MNRPLDALCWPVERLGEAMMALARRSGLQPREVDLPSPQAAAAIGPSNLPLERWIENAARWLGLEAELVECAFPDTNQLLAAVGPAILRMHHDGALFLLVLGARGGQLEILGPTLTVCRRRLELVRAALWEADEVAVASFVRRALTRLEVPPGQRARARAAIVNEQFRSTMIRRCWHLRSRPGASFLRHFRQLGGMRRLRQFVGAHALADLFFLLSWWTVGRAALTDQFDRGWLVAWGLMLLTVVPCRLWATWMGGQLALDLGALIKRRLLAGALNLAPDDIRQQGVGQLLGRVMESDELDALMLQGGFAALAAGMDILFAVLVLSAVGGVGTILLLLGWIGCTIILGWRYHRQRLAWTGERLDLTNALVERMVGHRTRLVQQQPAVWHEGEDHALARYLERSRILDRALVILTAVVPRGWLVIGLAGLAPIFIAAGASSTLAVALGGVLLAHRALQSLVAGLAQLSGAAVAWRQIRPLYQAADAEERSPPLEDPAIAAPYPGEGDPVPLVEASRLTFRHARRQEAVLHGCNLRIQAGDRLLLEGPSGSGKSTLMSLLAGWRTPQQGLLLVQGLDRHTLGQEGWRRRVVAAPQFQENYVLMGTFAFNLLMSRCWPPRPGDLEDAERLCQQLELGGLLSRMPAGMQQMVGETGWKLSHGEKSRLFIARALLQGADLVLLDESFGALDPETLESALRCTLQSAPALMVIAHP